MMYGSFFPLDKQCEIGYFYPRIFRLFLRDITRLWGNRFALFVMHSLNDSLANDLWAEIVGEIAGKSDRNAIFHEKNNSKLWAPNEDWKENSKKSHFQSIFTITHNNFGSRRSQRSRRFFLSVYLSFSHDYVNASRWSTDGGVKKKWWRLIWRKICSRGNVRR